MDCLALGVSGPGSIRYGVARFLEGIFKWRLCCGPFLIPSSLRST